MGKYYCDYCDVRIHIRHSGREACGLTRLSVRQVFLTHDSASGAHALLQLGTQSNGVS